MIELKEIKLNEIHVSLFSNFKRHQVVNDVWRKVKGKWVIESHPFIDDWTYDEYEILVDCLSHTIKTGGLVCGLFCEGILKGFVSVESEWLGDEWKYLDLTSLHVSEDMRGQGFGKLLFEKAVKWAKEKKADKLYISAHSAVETQAFYKKMGCVEAKYICMKHVEAEPFDCQLEYVL